MSGSRTGPPTTRSTLLTRLRDHGDDVAWQQFDRTYRDLILRYCRRRGLQSSDAEDVRQMVMLNLARQLPTFEYRPERGRFRGYLGQVVRNAIHRYYRRPRLESPGLETSVVADLVTDEREERDEAWEQEWMLHHYRLALATVRTTAEPRSVEIFEALLSGRTTDDVAADFGATRDAVHKVKQRMRDALKAAVARQVHDEELG